MTFYQLPENCHNCRNNFWRKDLIVELRTRGSRSRYSCFYCGYDIWPGGATRPSPQDEKRNEEWIRRNNEKWLEGMTHSDEAA